MYVSRRIKILNISIINSWFYINTGNNPPDLASRPQEISALDSSVWHHSPKFQSLRGYVNMTIELIMLNYLNEVD